MVSSSYKEEDNENDSFYMDNNIPAFITNRKGEIVDANDVFCQKIKCVKDEILGLTIEDTGLLTEESSKNAMYQHVSRLIGRGENDYSLDIKNKKGDILSLKIDTKPYIKNGRNVGEISIIRKISEVSKPKVKNKFERKAKSGNKQSEIQDAELMTSLENNNEIKYMKSKLEDKYKEMDSHKEEF